MTIRDVEVYNNFTPIVQAWAFSQYDSSAYDIEATLPRATSQNELAALTDFYNNLNGDLWRVNRNWLNGDPCLVNYALIYLEWMVWRSM
jgi:hypothetical protein